MNVGLIGLSQNFPSEFLKEFQKKNIKTFSMTLDNIKEHVDVLDGLIVRTDSTADVGSTCSLLIELRDYKKIYTWIYSPSQSKEIRSVYLNLGAVGLITEDINSEEFCLTVANVLKKKTFFEKSTELKRQIKLNARNLTLQIGDANAVHLTKLEYRAFELLSENSGDTVTYQMLGNHLWNSNGLSQKYRVANLIHHLREKIRDNISDTDYIRTIRSVGYMLDVGRDGY